MKSPDFIAGQGHFRTKLAQRDYFDEHVRKSVEFHVLRTLYRTMATLADQPLDKVGAFLTKLDETIHKEERKEALGRPPPGFDRPSPTLETVTRKVTLSVLKWLRGNLSTNFQRKIEERMTGQTWLMWE